MQKVLIAVNSQVLSEALTGQLSETYLIESCHDGQRALELIESFKPDILLLDMQIPSVDGFSILRGLHTAGKGIAVIVLSNLLNDRICSQLEQLQVAYALHKPSTVSTVTARICELGGQLAAGDTQRWCLENQTEQILLELGMHMGAARFYFTSNAILLKYAAPDGFMTKNIYPEVAKRFCGTATQVEKGIRDGIKAAWKRGNQAIWQLYFPPGRDGVQECPSNEVFIARIAGALRQKARIQKPYAPQEEKAQ